MNFTLMTIGGISFIFLMTVLGSAVVFCFKKEISPTLNALFLGLASGIMLAASVWSLILPALTQAEKTWQNYAFIPVSVGLLLGAGFLFLLDKWIAHCKKGEANGVLGNARRLFLAVTLHNIPEGLAVGFAFGAAWASGTPVAFISALGIAIGIGIQNFPEGMAISLPLHSNAKNKPRAFLYGTFSGAVEPVFAVLGLFLASRLLLLQPWLLSAAAGAMIFVVVADLIPEMHSAPTKNTPNKDSVGSWSVLFGFILMMILDVALG
ncbi:MAG: ZIP family metal transporter [Clostridia bacterium]|nr:ZIP family metal transporter [Clostridia bacterium]